MWMVSKRKYDYMERERGFERIRADFNLSLWVEQLDQFKLQQVEMGVTESALAAAESALDEKERIIERLQDDLYRMHDHLLYVREVMTDLP